jgi:hypothetical protein
MNLRKVTMEYGFLRLMIRHDSAEMFGFKYRLTLVIGTIKIMASTGVFVRVVCAFKHSIKIFSSLKSMLLVFSTCKKNLSSQFFDLDIEDPLGRGNLAKIDPPCKRTIIS